MTYELTPGTAAYRIVAWLEARGRTKEFNSAQIAYALHLDAKGLPTQLAPALQAGLVFRRQKDSSSPRAPFWYSLTDHGATHRREFRPSPKDWMHPINCKDAEESGSSPGTPGTAGTPAGTCASSAEVAAADAPSGDKGAAAGADRAAAPAIKRRNSRSQESGALTDPNATGNGNMARNTADAAPGGGPAEGEGATAPSPGIAAAWQTAGTETPPNGGAVLGHLKLPPRDLATTRRAVGYDEYGGKRYCAYCGQREGSPHLGSCQGSFRAARFSDGSLATERDGVVVEVYTAAETDAIQKLLGARG